MNLNDLRINAYKREIDNKDKFKKIPKEDNDEAFEIASANLRKTLNKFPITSLDDSSKEKGDEGLVKVPDSHPTKNGKESIYRRVAKFLIIIGEDEAAKILPHLTEDQIEKIVPELASIRSVDKEEASLILKEFNSLLTHARQSGGIETAREILVNAFGKEKAQQMLDKTLPYNGQKPFEYLNDADSERIYLLLKDENIGVQSLVLSKLEAKKAASVINIMTESEKKEIILRLAKMEAISPDVIHKVDEAIHKKSLKQTSTKAENIDGRNVLAQILKKMDLSAENDIINYLSEENPDLGQDLRSRLFTVEDVVKADDRFIQEELRKKDDREICYLIAGKSEEFREKILSNVSQIRKAEILDKEDILKPFLRVECEKVTSQFFSILRRAYEDGHLIIQGRNDDIYI